MRVNVRFPVVFLVLGFFLSLLFDVLLLRLVEQDATLRYLLTDWQSDSRAAFFLAGWLIVPLCALPMALWWHFADPTDSMFRGLHLTVGRVSLFAVALFLFNLALLNLSPVSTSIGDPAIEGLLAHLRNTGLSPTFLVPDLLLMAGAIWWVFSRKIFPACEVDRIVVFAMALGNIGGIALLYLAGP